MAGAPRSSPAVRAIAAEVAAGDLAVDAVDEDCLARHLFTVDLPDPDLLIRTSGEQRISNFLLWQCAYSELVFTKTLWPDFSKSDLDQAIDDYCGRERRYGAGGWLALSRARCGDASSRRWRWRHFRSPRCGSARPGCRC